MKYNVIIITCFQTYEIRADYIKNYFTKNNQSVLVISTDFMHREKEYRCTHKDGYIFIHTKPYQRNLSLKRIYSHYKFAKDAIQCAYKYQPEILYVMIPCNSLSKYASLYKRHNGCTLILDIIDLWPESIPLKVIKKMWPFSRWKAMRDNYLMYADLVITECSLYQKTLITLSKLSVPTATVYWPYESHPYDYKLLSLDWRKFRFLYLGSINNIIDISSIIPLLLNIQKKRNVEVVIIGDGENRITFLKMLKNHNIPYIFHGIIYEHSQISEIAHSCHFALNILKPSVCVGLTMKSVSYFELGLPVINNLHGDLEELIQRYKCGFNIYDIDDYSEIENICSEELRQYHFNSRYVFNKYFSPESFELQLEKAVKLINKV